jgi:hypothetical protein
VRARQEFRQHSKSTLLRASTKLFQERDVLLLVEGRKWKRRMVAAACAAFLAGAGIGTGFAKVSVRALHDRSTSLFHGSKGATMQNDREPYPDQDKDGRRNENTERGKDTIGPGGRPTPPDHRGENPDNDKK